MIFSLSYNLSLTTKANVRWYESPRYTERSRNTHTKKKWEFRWEQTGKVFCFFWSARVRWIFGSTHFAHVWQLQWMPLCVLLFFFCIGANGAATADVARRTWWHTTCKADNAFSSYMPMPTTVVVMAFRNSFWTLFYSPFSWFFYRFECNRMNGPILPSHKILNYASRTQCDYFIWIFRKVKFFTLVGS